MCLPILLPLGAWCSTGSGLATLSGLVLSVGRCCSYCSATPEAEQKALHEVLNTLLKREGPFKAENLVP